MKKPLDEEIGVTVNDGIDKMKTRHGIRKVMERGFTASHTIRAMSNQSAARRKVPVTLPKLKCLED